MKDKFDILGGAQQQREQEQMLAFKKAVEDSPYIVCNKCGNGTFIQANFLKNVSGLRTGNGVDLIVPQQIFICGSCGSIISGYEENKLVYPDRFDVANGTEVSADELAKLEKQKPTPPEQEKTSSLII